MMRQRVARACSALARCNRLLRQNDVVRRGSSITGTFFTLDNDGGTFFTSWPASLVFAKRYILNPTVHSLDPGHHTCLCRDVLEAAHSRCKQAYGDASHYSTYGCVLVSDVIDATSAKHMKFGQTHWIDEEARVMDAVRQMFVTHLSALVVMQREALDADRSGVISDEELLLSAENDAIVGIITERDYLNAVAQGNIGLDTKVKDIMTDFKHSDAGESKKKLIFASPHSTALAAIETMTNNRLRHIPVIGSKGFDNLGNPIQPRVLGVISIGELLKSVLAEARSEIHQLECYIHGDAEYSAEEHVSGHSNDVKVETREQRDEASLAK